jgi:hypothetical protein
MQQFKSSSQRKRSDEKPQSFLFDDPKDPLEGSLQSLDFNDVIDDPAELDIKHFSDESAEMRKTPSTIQTEIHEPRTPTEDYEDITISRAMDPQNHRRQQQIGQEQSVAFWTEGSESLYNTTFSKSKLSASQSLIRTIPLPRGNHVDDPIQYLLLEEKSTNMRLNELLLKHSQASKKGISTRTIRDRIARCFKSLGQIYQATAELYDAQMKQRVQILESFKHWEDARRMLNGNIEEIKSDNNIEGHRLRQLEEESNTIDEEIKELEKRLSQLKSKKKVLSTEIERSQSVIESRTSSHLEALKQIDDSERDVIKRLFDDRSLVAQVSKMMVNEQRPASMLGSFLTRFSPQTYPQVSDYDPDQIIDIIERQVESLKDTIRDYEEKDKVYEESLIIWESTSEILSDLEHNLKITLNSQTKDTPDSTKQKLKSLLAKALEILNTRMDSIKNMNDILKTLFQTEIFILQTGIHMLEPKVEVPKDRTSPLFVPPPRTISAAEATLSTSPPQSIVGVNANTFTPTTSLGNRLKDNLTGKRSTSISEKNKSGKKD